MSGRFTREISNDANHYINIADCRGRMYSYSESLNQVSAATWAQQPAVGSGLYSSLLITAGGAILKDMGKTVVSSSRTFRKVQLVVAGSVSTFGAGGLVGSSYPATDFLTAYIELGFDGAGTPTQVAQFGR
jgi:hypothetical protein